MRSRLKLMLLVAMLWPIIAIGQVEVTGTVTSEEDGTPLQGVTVALKGTTKGTITDEKGSFKLQADFEGQEVTFSFIGMETVTMKAGSGSLNVSMAEGVLLKEVAITALGFETDRDKIGVASTRIDGGAVNDKGETRLIQNMAGKSPGVNIIQSTGDPGAGSRIQIRGATSITGSLEPLVVVDGIPIFNDYLYGQAFGGQQPNSSGSLGSGGGVTQQSRMNDINPDDVESIEILRGAAAAALFGSRAANGVIMITTKKGKGINRKDFTVNVNSALSLERVNRKVSLNETWGQGTGGIFYQGAPASFFRSLSWGDKISNRSGGADAFITDPNDPLYMGSFTSDQSGMTYYRIADGDLDNPSGGKNSTTTYDPYDLLFETGVTLDNSVNVSTSDEKGSIYFSLADLRQTGVIKENSTYQKNNVRLNIDRRINDKFRYTANAAYAYTSADRVQMGSNLNGLFLGGLRSPADFNMEDYSGTYTDVDGNQFPDRPRAFRNALGANPGYGYDNPLWMMNNTLSTSVVNRTLGKMELNYSPLDFMDVTARAGWDHYTDVREDFFHHFSSGENLDGRFVKENIERLQLNWDLFARANFDLTDDIGLNALVGWNVNDQSRDHIATDARSFINPASPPQVDNSTIQVLNNYEVHQRTIGAYATANFNFYDEVFVNLAARNDWLSTLPEGDNSVFYPAADVAWQFGKYLPEATKISFAKLRLGWGQVGRGPGAYALQTGFIAPDASIAGFGEGWGPGVNPQAYGGGFVQTNVAGNPNIRAEIKTELEIGTDLRFFRDRARLSFTYYTNTTEDLIIDVDLPNSTGFEVQVLNGATIENRGIELELGGDVIKKGDFNWFAYGNYTRNRNEVTEMNGVNSISLGGFAGTSSRAVLGEQLGVIWGGMWDRDGAGNLVLDANGFPMEAEQPGVIGDPNPEFRAGLGSELTYKNWSFNFLFDCSVGFDLWNGTKGALAFFGTAGYTDVETTLSEAQANSLQIWTGATVAETYPHYQNADGSYSVRGEISNFGGGDVFLDENWYNFGPGSGFTGPSEQFIEDASWYRLREVSLSYDMTKDQVGGFLGLEGLRFTFAVNNVFLITDYDGNDPDQTLTGSGNNAFGLDYFQNPSTRAFRIGINATL